MNSFRSECLCIEEMRNYLCHVFQSQAIKMSKRRKLVLHFDVNKTIVAVDSATGETVEDSLNVYLSGMAWGKENAGKWECAVNELSLHPQETGNVSFYKFEERKFDKQNRHAFRYQLSSFTDKPQGSNFKPYLNMLLQKLTWRIPYDESLHGHMTVPGTKDFRYHFILPSFFKLLNHLVTNNRDFAIIFRTFGSDANSVLKSITESIEQKMPFCVEISSLSNKIANEILLLRRKTGNKFTLSSETTNSGFVRPVERTDDEMYEYMTSRTGITAISDDLRDWSANNFHPSKGKPIWINLQDDDTHHIFFDDNIRPANSDSIVNLRLKRECSESYEDVQTHEEFKYVNKNIVPVTFPDAIMNEDYFIEKLQLCESSMDTS